MNPVDIAAWAVDAVILASYGLVSRRPQHMPLFNKANLVGGVVLVVYGVRHGAVAAAALSAAYCLIALRAIVWHRK